MGKVGYHTGLCINDSDCTIQSDRGNLSWKKRSQEVQCACLAFVSEGDYTAIVITTDAVSRKCIKCRQDIGKKRKKDRKEENGES